MNETEWTASVIVIVLAFLMIAWGLLRLRGTGLLQRRKTEDYPFISREHNYDFPQKSTWDTTAPLNEIRITKKEIQDDFQKEDDLE